MPSFQDAAEISEFRRALQVGHDPHEPYVAICGGTGCLALGAAEVRQAFEEAIAKNGVKVKVRMKFTGCHGFCEKGPLVVIHPQEHLYVGVKAKDVPEILEKAVGQNGLVEHLLYQDPATKERTARERERPLLQASEAPCVRDERHDRSDQY